MTVLTLNNWSYKKAEESNWRPARKGYAATEIHPDLLNNGEIPDPFIDDNEKKVQWIGEADWEYKTDFEIDAAAEKLQFHELFFEGLDTFADVYLNGAKILSTESMFIEYRENVTKHLKFGAANELRIYFHSALLKARALEKKYGKHGCFNGETNRVQIRKAQYHYGWDWGPLLMTCGPYKPVHLLSYNIHVEDVFVDANVAEDLTAAIDIKTNIVGTADLDITVVAPSGETVKTFHAKAVTGQQKHSLVLDKPELWFPFSHGTPHLYTFAVAISNGTQSETVEKKVAIRRAELVQEPFDDQPGSSFYFRINNVPVYCSGSDWIPGHSFQTCLTEKDYTDWMEIMVNGHQNMIRIWGGGFYEQNIFYEECDRLGILIWHDFMFACGQYPGNKPFLDLVEAEVRTQLKKLRNYNSIVLWCGNNEDYQCAEKLQLKWDKSDTSGDYTATDFPARTLYEGMFPKLVKELTSNIPYHPGSPWGGSGTEDNTIGDIHQWNVWHGKQEKYQNWYKLGGRFVSEFGMEGLPCKKTYTDCITEEDELYPQSYMVDHHNKSDGYERRLALYVMENIKVRGMDLEPWIYATQLMQSECLGYAYRCWRREWRGDKKRYSGGTIVWQINDCWPCASWAIVDFFKRPKLAYYSVKRESQPINLGLYRNEEREDSEFRKSSLKMSAPFDYSEVHYNVDIWGVNSTTKDFAATLKVTLYNVTTGQVVKELDDEEVVLKANQTTELVTHYTVPDKLPVVVYARIVVDGQTVAGAGDWPQPLKYLKFPGREVTAHVENDYVVVTTNKPVKGIEITLENDLYIDDNGFDLFPGEKKKVLIKGLKKSDPVHINYYQKA